MPRALSRYRSLSCPGTTWPSDMVGLSSTGEPGTKADGRSQDTCHSRRQAGAEGLR